MDLTKLDNDQVINLYTDLKKQLQYYITDVEDTLRALEECREYMARHELNDDLKDDKAAINNINIKLDELKEYAKQNGIILEPENHKKR